MKSYLQFWGKAQPLEPVSVSWHPLAWHSLDVAAVAEMLLNWDSSIAEELASQCGGNVTAAQRLLITLSALHDIGKFSIGFQAKVRDRFPAVLTFPQSPKVGDHPAIGQRMLGEPGMAACWDRLTPNLGSAARQVLAGAVAGHHGRPASPLPRWLPDEIGNKAIEAAADFFCDIVDLLAGDPFIGHFSDTAAKAFSWRLAGFINLADWIGSNQRIFRYEPPEIALVDYWQRIARSRAGAAVTAAGLSRKPVSPFSGFRALTGRSDLPSPLQAHCETSGGLQDGPTFYLIEDMTGAGKTEAALVLAHRLMQAGRADGIFVALPTQATANAMYARLSRSYRRLFGDGAWPSLALSHGGAGLHDGFQDSILDVGAFEAVRKGMGGEETASAACAAWIGSDRRRSVFADVGVGTIDQTFLSVLPVKFAALRMLGLSRKVLILDEIHAYGAYESEELVRLIEFHAARGGSVIALSATLPEGVKARLLRAWRNGLRVKGDAAVWQPAYPLFTRLDGAGTVTQQPIAPRQDLLQRTVRVERLASPEASLDAIADAVAQGAAVAWIRNTVDDVLTAQVALAERGIEATVFHARFAMCDRQKIEADVIAAFGPTSEPEQRRGRVIVASQVIEQSIDVDFDLMVSDLAPVDLLIQRAGRLWRHGRTVRPLSSPRLLVVSPDPEGDVSTDWLSRPLRGTAYVYANHALMWLTAETVFATGAIVSPSGIRPLIEAVYAKEALDAAPKTLERSRLEAEGREQGDRSVAAMNLLQIRDGYSFREEWSPEIHTPTRIGEERTIFRLARWDGEHLSPWAGPIDAGMSSREVERLWALSEVAVSRRRASGRGDYPPEIERAAKSIEAEWGEFGGCVVLPLLGEGADFTASATKGNGSVPVGYKPAVGLILAEIG